MTEARRATLGEGLRLLGRAIRDEPHVLGVAIAGSAVFGSMIVVAAEVIGRVTDEVIVPSFADGDYSTGALVAAAVAIVGVALVKAAGIVVRRYFAGFDGQLDDVRFEPLELIDEGHRVIAALRLTGRGTTSGIEVEQRAASVLELRDGKVVRIESHPDVEAARRAG